MGPQIGSNKSNTVILGEVREAAQRVEGLAMHGPVLAETAWSFFLLACCLGCRCLSRLGWARAELCWAELAGPGPDAVCADVRVHGMLYERQRATSCKQEERNTKTQESTCESEITIWHFAHCARGSNDIVETAQKQYADTGGQHTKTHHMQRRQTRHVEDNLEDSMKTDRPKIQ